MKQVKKSIVLLEKLMMKTGNTILCEDDYSKFFDPEYCDIIIPLRDLIDEGIATEIDEGCFALNLAGLLNYIDKMDKKAIDLDADYE